MDILACTRHFLPGYKAGGPIISISNMINYLGNEFNFHLVTTDRDISDKEPYDHIPQDRWNSFYNAQVIYLPPESISLRRLSDLEKEVKPRYIYLNSFFDTRFTAKMLMLHWRGQLSSPRIILAPRGEFSAGALSINPLRKRVYKATLQRLGLLSNIEWHASTQAEANDIEKAIGRTAKDHIHVAPDLGSMPDDAAFAEWQPRIAGRPLRICFLSRVSPMKNLLGAIRAIGRMQKAAQMTVYGPKEDAAYWDECLRAARHLPDHVHFEDGGILIPNEVHRTIARFDVFFLPTLGENYGHVIAEALSVGLPVVVSDRAPWRGLAEKGVGYDGPLDEEAFARKLDWIASMDARTSASMRETCRQFARTVLTDPEAVKANRRLFAA